MRTGRGGTDTRKVSTLEAQVQEAQTVLDAWHAQFGTTQLSHAVARLQAAEERVRRLETQGRELVAAMEKYGTHQLPCVKGQAYWFEDATTPKGEWRKANCKCGLDARMTTLRRNR